MALLREKTYLKDEVLLNGFYPVTAVQRSS